MRTPTDTRPNRCSTGSSRPPPHRRALANHFSGIRQKCRVLRSKARRYVVRTVEEPLIDRNLLEKLERLTVRWQKSFPGLVGGHNLSRYPGPGIEFLDHRHFHHGDDLRAVNWRAYLRLEKLFLKM